MCLGKKLYCFSIRRGQEISLTPYTRKSLLNNELNKLSRPAEFLNITIKLIAKQFRSL